MSQLNFNFYHWWIKNLFKYLQISAKSEDSQPQSCFPWPDKLLSIRECCNTPFHYNSALLNHCYFGCKSLSLDAFEQNDCASRCYTNYTLLVNDDGELNKNVVKRIYNGNAFNEPKWMKVINETVDFCDYNKSDSLTESLASFYECVNSKLENSCVKFINTRECDEVEEYFESCKNIQPDCNIWPDDLINPEGCCKTVPLFNREIQQTCRQNCAMKELYIPRQVNCTWRCMFNDSKVHMDGKFDFSVVKFLLIQNSKSNPDWEKPIEIAVEKCEEKLKGLCTFFSVLWSLNFFFIRNGRLKHERWYEEQVFVDLSARCYEWRMRWLLRQPKL